MDVFFLLINVLLIYNKVNENGRELDEWADTGLSSSKCW